MSFIEEDFGAALIAAGYRNTKYFEFDESTPDQIFIKSGGGTVDCISSEDGSGSGDISRPRVQIQVRSAGTDAAAMKKALTDIMAIKTLLHRGQVANCIGVYWDGRQPEHYRDAKNRHVFLIEFKVMRARGA